MSKQKKHTLSLDQDYEYEMIGICSHHNDYRLVWGINKSLSVNLFKSIEDFSISNKKGTANLAFSIYEFKDEESLHEFYLVKNKNLGKNKNGEKRYFFLHSPKKKARVLFAFFFLKKILRLVSWSVVTFKVHRLLLDQRTNVTSFPCHRLSFVFFLF